MSRFPPDTEHSAISFSVTNANTGRVMATAAAGQIIRVWGWGSFSDAATPGAGTCKIQLANQAGTIVYGGGRYDMVTNCFDRLIPGGILIGVGADQVRIYDQATTAGPHAVKHYIYFTREPII